MTLQKIKITEENISQYTELLQYNFNIGQTAFITDNPEEAKVVNQDTVSNMITLVTDKLFKSSQKYGASSYVLNDMTREIQEEIVDILGWSLMESIRLMEALKGKIYHADEIYWENFLQKQNTEFLKVLLDKVMGELEKRRNKQPFVGYVVNLTYFRESGKYYEEGYFTTSEPSMYNIIEEVKRKIKTKKLPGLTDGAGGLDVLIDAQDHPQNVPQILKWSMHGN